ncbi:PREDICTED: uncharacterized protein LOC102025345 isoform X2 [Chinchilla lanigera]|uniref:uncharacterized protein LOC102025345 isoform X2 n=1 Tax=Chinchilla lanigera TaxID=34839 RepID=UPI00038EB0EF|nr:PREDICTED: uncharacterized protein LOC102025345 isoform X2 [Chinchilla lanigera]
MAKMSRVVTFFVLFLDSWPSAERYPYPQVKGSDSTFSSSSTSMEKDMAKIFDDILQQVSPKELDVEVFGKTSTTVGPVTREDLDESYFQRNSSRNSEFASSSNKEDEHLKKILDDILQQVSPKELDVEVFGKTSTTVGPVTREDLDEKASVSRNSEEEDDILERMDKLPDDDRISKKRDRVSSLVNNDVTAGVLRQGTSPDLPCGELLHFLQKNIITVAGAVAMMFGVMVLLVFALTSYMKRRQSLTPPANMTYNIFILDEKSWWQKPQESPRQFAEKQKQLK